MEKNLLPKEELNRYKQFAFKDDMFKLAIGFILGNSFNNVVGGISSFLIMPVVNFLTVQTGENWRTIVVSPVNGLNFELGKLLGTFVDFLLTSIVLYVIYVKILGSIKKQDENCNLKQCNRCLSLIHINATRCKFCTSPIKK